jgi:hypothetical protein
MNNFVTKKQTIKDLESSGWNPEGKDDTEKKRHEMEIRLKELDPRTYLEAVNRKRADELELMDESLRPMQKLIWAKELEYTNGYKTLELWKLQGKSLEALAIERYMELKTMDPTTQAIQKQIWAQEDLNKLRDMDIELMKISGRSMEAQAMEREIALKALTPEQQVKQKQIWAQELVNQKRQLEIDLMNAQGKTAEALAATREEELKTLDPSLWALKKMIWAEEDLAKKRSEIIDKNYKTLVDFKRAMATGEVGNIKGYDSGGYHPGGLRVVGESGPELEWTGPSNIFNPKKMSITAGTNDLVTEIRGMREEMHALGVQTVMNTGKSARVMSRWDADGQPDIRFNNSTRWGN